MLKKIWKKACLLAKGVGEKPTSASRGKGGWYFLVGLTLMLAPTLILYILLEALAWKTGETMPMNVIAQWQTMGPNRLWRGGDGRSYVTYKAARIMHDKPQVLFLGASRGNSFRHEDFEPYTFYNAAVCGWTFTHYLRFLKMITAEGYAPKVLFFNLDYWMFSSDFDAVWSDRFYDKPETHWAALKMVLDHTLDSIDWPWQPPHVRPAVFPGMPDPNHKVWDRLSSTDHLKGLYAVLSGDGFRRDGALLLPDDNLPTDPSRLMNDSYILGDPPTEGGDAMAPNQLAAFEEFERFAKSKDIALIGVQLPYYDKIVSGFEKYPHAGIWREIGTPERKKYFNEHQTLFYNFAADPAYRYHPELFLDSVHPSSALITEIIHRLRADPDVRAAFRSKGLVDPLLLTNSSAP